MLWSHQEDCAPVESLPELWEFGIMIWFSMLWFTGSWFLKTTYPQGGHREFTLATWPCSVVVCMVACSVLLHAATAGY